MNHTAFIFPGQGAQAIGMGQDFYENFACSRRIFETAGEVSGLDMEALCFEENDNLNLTEYTQIALVTTETAILEAVKEAGYTGEVYAGLSLGEYTAITAAGALSFADAARIVRQRGILMQDTVPAGAGTMAAIVGLEVRVIEELIGSTEGEVGIANYNSPAQTVITGEKQAVLAVKEKAEKSGAKMVVELNVSGPFHSSMLRPAGDKMRKVLEEVSLSALNAPYVANLTGDYVEDAGIIKESLIQQIYSPVCWYQGIERMIARGITTFVEIGPGRTLAGFNKKINKEVRTINIAKVEDLEKLK